MNFLHFFFIRGNFFESFFTFGLCIWKTKVLNNWKLIRIFMRVFEIVFEIFSKIQNSWILEFVKKKSKSRKILKKITNNKINGLILNEKRKVFWLLMEFFICQFLNIFFRFLLQFYFFLFFFLMKNSYFEIAIFFRFAKWSGVMDWRKKIRWCMGFEFDNKTFYRNWILQNFKSWKFYILKKFRICEIGKNYKFSQFQNTQNL